MTTKGQMKPTSWQGDFNGVPGRREQPNQWPRTYDCSQYSNRPDLQKKSRKKSSIVGTIIKQVKKLRSSNAFQNSKSTQHCDNNSINSNINLDLGFSEIKDKTTVPNPLNPSIKHISLTVPSTTKCRLCSDLESAAMAVARPTTIECLLQLGGRPLCCACCSGHCSKSAANAWRSLPPARHRDERSTILFAPNSSLADSC